MKKGVLILECLDQSDPGSEGKFLSHMFDLMGVDNQYVEIRTRAQFISMIKSCPYKVIHITTHGEVEKISSNRERFKGWWTQDGPISKTIIDDNLENSLTGKIIVSTACLSGYTKYANYLIEKTGCKYYIAPEGSPSFHNSIFFAHIFYHKYFILNNKLNNIFERYDSRYKNPHEFSYFQAKNRT